MTNYVLRIDVVPLENCPFNFGVKVSDSLGQHLIANWDQHGDESLSDFIGRILRDDVSKTMKDRMGDFTAHILLAHWLKT